MRASGSALSSFTHQQVPTDVWTLINSFANAVWETMESLCGSKAQWKSSHIFCEVGERALPHDCKSSSGRSGHKVNQGKDCTLHLWIKEEQCDCPFPMSVDA